VGAAVGLVGPRVERSLLPVTLKIGCGLVEVEIECLEIVHARNEEPMAKGVLVVRVIGGLEYPHRILALSIVGSMALPAELIAGLCGQILGHDDLRLI